MDPPGPIWAGGARAAHADAVPAHIGALTGRWSMIHRQASFHHHFFQVAQGQATAKVAPDAQNDRVVLKASSSE